MTESDSILRVELQPGCQIRFKSCVSSFTNLFSRAVDGNLYSNQELSNVYFFLLLPSEITNNGGNVETDLISKDYVGFFQHFRTNVHT